MSEIDYGARARLDYIEKQLRALFPDSYVPFAESGTSGMPAAVVELARAAQLRGVQDGYVPVRDRRAPSGPHLPTAARRSGQLARAGNLIAAIKEYRQITGVGLAEAKKAVEDIR